MTVDALSQLLTVASVALALGVSAVWLRGLRRGRLPEWHAWIARGHVAVVALAGAGLVLAASAWVQVIAGIALAGSGTFLLLGLQAAQPQGIAVSVGGPILDFTATAASGERFALSSMRGKPYLLKFYRGHW